MLLAYDHNVFGGQVAVGDIACGVEAVDDVDDFEKNAAPREQGPRGLQPDDQILAAQVWHPKDTQIGTHHEGGRPEYARGDRLYQIVHLVVAKLSEEYNIIHTTMEV